MSKLEKLIFTAYDLRKVLIVDGVDFMADTMHLLKTDNKL